MAESIRHLTEAECALMVDWAAAEGWNPGRHDGAAFFASDPGGYWGLFEGPEPVATISAVRYGDAFAFIGFYICRPDRRGRGLGYRLWQHALKAVEGMPIGLDGVVAQQDNYRKSGFALAHRNVRYGGRPLVTRVPDPRLHRLSARDIPSMVDLERALRLFPTDRPRFLEAWLAMPGTIGFRLGTGDTIDGYGVIRPCRDGWKIGPLFAGNPDDAMLLARALIAETGPGSTVYLDPPEPNLAARRLVESLGLQPVFETARMYRGPVPDLALHRIYGITSFELG